MDKYLSKLRALLKTWESVRANLKDAWESFFPPHVDLQDAPCHKCGRPHRRIDTFWGNWEVCHSCNIRYCIHCSQALRYDTIFVVYCEECDQLMYPEK